MESRQLADGVSIVVKAVSTVLGLEVDEIRTIGKDSTFVKLGGDSLTAILIATECQKGGISIRPTVFLQASTLSEAIAKAESSAQLLNPPSAPSQTTIPTPGLLPSRSDGTPIADSSSHSEVSGDDSSSLSSSCDTTITTPDFAASTKTLSCHNGQPVLSARDLLGRIDATEWTEPQLLLLRETCDNPKLNMLTIQKTYSGEWDAQLVCDVWKDTILAEPIFQDLIADLGIPPQQFMPWRTIKVDTEEAFQRELHDAGHVHGPLAHLAVVELAALSVAAVWRIHHAFMDGFAARILDDKVAHSLQAGGLAAVPGPSFNNAVLGLGRLREERREATRRFWENQRARFPDAASQLCLNPQRSTAQASQRSTTIPFPEARLAAAQARTGYTTIVYAAAAWALTLGTFMDADQVCFGMVLSGRDLPVPGALDVVGPLINMLPLFVQLPLVEGDRETSPSTVGAFLGRIRDDIFGLNEMSHSETTDGFDRQFTSIMGTQFEVAKGAEQVKSPPADSNCPDMQSGVPLSLIVQGHSGLQVFYSTARYSEEDMKNLRSVFENAMDRLLQGDDERPLAPEARQGLMPREMEQMIRQWSSCESLETLDESKGDDLVTLFEGVVGRHPTAVAVTRGQGRDMTYDDFDRAAAVVARELSWIGANEPVCVYADRSVNWLVAIFGVLKAGGIYAPLDPSAPASVRHANFALTGARVLLFPSSASISADTAPMNTNGTSSCLVMAVDKLVEANRAGSLQDGLSPYSSYYPRRRIARPDDLAYICFTSGSTGRPKAVQCTHKGLVAFQKDHLVRLGAEKGVVVAQVMSPVFDGSIHEIFSALTHGATLRLASPEDQDHPFAHLRDCDAAILTPSIANALDPDQYPRLRNVYLVGEAVPQSVSDAWSKDHSLYNMYGPTEATCGATIKQLAPGQPVTLGRPTPSSRVYILDRNRRLLPPGAVGELYLAGIQVSHGYINLPTENANRFLPDSVLPAAGQKMYKTGDFAYRDSRTGEICIVGRKDRQIKLHGFRLDLDDLEVRITKAIPGCRSAAVFCRDDYLVAAYQTPSSLPASELSESEVRKLIGDALPPYAMPRRILALSQLPLTAAGKLDYKKLKQMDSTSVSRPQPQQRESSMTGTERMIVQAVRDLMKLDSSIQVDQDSDLAALGGHSIVQLQLAGRISSLIQRKISLRTIINNPVISRLAAAVDEMMKGEPGEAAGHKDGLAERDPCLRATRSEGAGAAIDDDSSLVSSIEGVWFSRYQQNLGTLSFNVTHLSELDDSFDQHEALVAAWTKVLARHEILRCRFRPSTTAPGGVERLYAAEPPRAVYVDSFDCRAAINAEFSLETEHPIRVLVSRRHMLVCVSHIICDYTTLDRLLEEFAAAYHHDDGAEASLLASQRRYQDASWRNADVDQVTAAFWRSYLSGIDAKTLPPYMKQARASHHGQSRMFRLSSGAMHSLETISRSLRLTMHQIALAVVSLVLQADNPTKQDLILGSPYFGRQEEDMNTIGLFLQPLPIRVPRRSSSKGPEAGGGGGGDDLSDAAATDFLLAVQDSARSALGHAIPWSSLLDLLASSDDENLRSAAATTPGGASHPLFDAMVTFHEERGAAGRAPSIARRLVAGVEPLITWAEGAKFAIMFEFSALASTAVTLRIEYDSSLFSAEEVLAMAERIDSGLGYLCQSMAVPMKVRDLEDRLCHADGAVHGRDGIRSVEFGTRLAALT